MSSTMTAAEFAGKVAYEGGLYDAIAGYGLSERDLVPDENPELWKLVKEYTRKATELDVLGSTIQDMLETAWDEANSE